MPVGAGEVDAAFLWGVEVAETGEGIVFGLDAFEVVIAFEKEFVVVL
jgi:hypothetical protein